MNSALRIRHVVLGLFIAMLWRGTDACLPSADAQENRFANPFVDVPAKSEPTSPTTIELPAPLTEVDVGGDGRYLVANLRSLRQIATIDLRSKKLVRLTPSESEDVLIAASRDSLYVLARDDQTLTRYSLETGTQDLTVASPVIDPVVQLMIGSSANSPLVFVCDCSRQEGMIRLYDPVSMKELFNSKNKQLYYHADSKTRMRMSADGRTFSASEYLFHWSGDELRLKRNVEQRRPVTLPNFGGSRIYSAGYSYDRDLNVIDSPASNRTIIPATSAHFYLSIPTVFSNGRGRAYGGSVGVHLEGYDRPLFVLDRIDTRLSFNERAIQASGLDFTERFVFSPSENAVLQIPTQNDRILVHSVDIQNELEVAGVDFLYVAPQFIPEGVRGKIFRLKIDARSKRGGTRFRIVSGPTGMSVDSSGVITWMIPKDFGPDKQPVALELVDQSKQVISHSISIAIASEAPMSEREREEADYRRMMSSSDSLEPKPSGHVSPQGTGSGESRTWTDIEGNSVVATLSEHFGGMAYLRSESGVLLVVPTNKLSESDRKHLQEQAMIKKMQAVSNQSSPD